LRAQRFQNRETVGLRHHQIQQDQVGLESVADFERRLGIGDRLEARVLIFR
jgi:hypothetical protein